MPEKKEKKKSISYWTKFKNSKTYEFLKDFFIPANILSLAALLIAFVSLQVNWDMKAISAKQDSTSVTIDTFKKLLLKTDVLITQQSQQLEIYKQELEQLKSLIGKTDTVIGLSNNELAINRKSQEESNRNREISDIGYMNELYTTAYGINQYYFDNMIFVFKPTVTPENLEEGSRHIEQLQKMFMGAMTNPYLNRYTDLHLNWRYAYAVLTNCNREIRHQIFLCNSYVTERDSIGNVLYQGMGKLDTSTMINLYTRGCSAAGGVCHSIMDFINNERRARGFLVDYKIGDKVVIKHLNNKEVTIIRDKDQFDFYMCAGNGKNGKLDTVMAIAEWMKKK